MPYQIFEKSTHRGSGNPPTLTIGPSGRLGFNKSASERFRRDVIQHALLLWDAQAKKIAIRPIKKKDPKAFSVTLGKKGKGATIAAKSFCQFIGIDKILRLPVTWSETESAFEASLGDGQGETPADQQKLQLHKRSARTA